MVKVSLAGAPRELAMSLVGGWNWWTDGIIPRAVWAVALGAGLALWGKSRGDWLRLLMPFLVVVILNLLQRVAPPPRIYLFLFPWLAVLSAHGVTRLFEALCKRAPESAKLGSVGPLVTAWAATAAVCFGGGWHAAKTDVLFNATERSNFRYLRDVMERLALEIREGSIHQRRNAGTNAQEDGATNRLIAPLPCDLPALFYRERDGIPVEINGSPSPGESLWLMTRQGESPAQVLASPLIDLPGYSEPNTDWKLIEAFQTLRLHRYIPRDEQGDVTQPLR
jgi:hypothetical protein